MVPMLTVSSEIISPVSHKCSWNQTGKGCAACCLFLFCESCRSLASHNKFKDRRDDAHMAPKTPTLPLSPPPLLHPSPLRLQSANGNQQTPISTATVSMVHSVPELMVSSEVSLEKWETRKTWLREYYTLEGHLESKKNKKHLQALPSNTLHVFVLYKLLHL